MNSLSEIKSRYPKSIKAKPKGWKFICGKTIIRKGDMIWTKGCGPFIDVANSFNTTLVGSKAETCVPVIRQIKIKTKPKITPLPEALKTSLPKGYIYLGKGREFKSCGSDVGKFIYTTDGKAWRNDNTYMMSGPSCYYAFPDDSEIVRLNGVKPNIPSLLEENAALKKELADLKAKIAALIEK